MYLPNLPESDVLTYKFVFYHTNLTAAANTQTIFLFGMPENFAVCAVKINPTITFVGTGFTSITCSVGPTGAEDFYAAPFNMMQSSAFQTSSSLAQFSSAAYDLNTTFDSTGALLNLTVAGQVELTIQIRPLP